MGFTPEDFKSSASAIPPLARGIVRLDDRTTWRGHPRLLRMFVA